MSDKQKNPPKDAIMGRSKKIDLDAFCADDDQHPKLTRHSALESTHMRRMVIIVFVSPVAPAYRRSKTRRTHQSCLARPTGFASTHSPRSTCPPRK